MIPYVTLPPLFIGSSVVVQPFALLVCVGVLVAHLLLVRRAGQVGLTRARAAEMSLAMVVCGFAGALLFKLLYRPELLATWWSGGGLAALPGLSSFGGLFGALAGGWFYLAARRESGAARWKYFDAAAFALPFGFAFGRLGCTVTHDHPGLLAARARWLTVAYPDGPRWDLGLLEFIFLVLAAAAFWRVQRLALPDGLLLGLTMTGYGIFRVGLDQLHVDPPRYAGFSVDQWAGTGVAVLGAYLLRRTVTRAGPL